MKVILALVLAVMLVPINNSAFGKEASPEFNTTSQCQLMQKALMNELHPKIMSALRDRYRTDFLFDNARVLPTKNSDHLVSKFMIEGIVTKGNSSETVQLTFRADRTNGYRADGLNVVSRQLRK